MVELTFMPCSIEHIKLINPQEGMESEKAMFLHPDYSYVVAENFSISAWAGVKCIGAAGIIPIYKGRSIAWAIIGKEAGKYMRQITRKVRQALELDPADRIEMLVTTDFETGHRWAKMLGFECEAPRMRKHGIFGQDESLYARVK